MTTGKLRMYFESLGDRMAEDEQVAGQTQGNYKSTCTTTTNVFLLRPCLKNRSNFFSYLLMISFATAMVIVYCLH